MIGSLRGVVLDRSAARGGGEVLVEVAGVGYRVTVTPATLGQAHVGEPLLLHVHTHVREDALVLYGFATREERDCFEALLGAHGVGPSLAVAILSALSPAGLRLALASGDGEALTAVPGVGRKTAARLMVELRSCLDPPAGGPVADPGGIPGAHSEVRVALAGLGYGPEEVTEALRDLPADGAVQDLLRQALRRLAGARGGRARVAGG